MLCVHEQVDSMYSVLTIAMRSHGGAGTFAILSRTSAWHVRSNLHQQARLLACKSLRSRKPSEICRSTHIRYLNRQRFSKLLHRERIAPRAGSANAHRVGRHPPTLFSGQLDPMGLFSVHVCAAPLLPRRRACSSAETACSHEPRRSTRPDRARPAKPSRYELCLGLSTAPCCLSRSTRDRLPSDHP